jgi:hypothetical protein
MDSIEQIKAKADRVAAEHADVLAAKDAEEAAEAALLEKVVEAVRPALRALASRVKTADRVEHFADVDRQRETETLATWRGLCLTGTPGPLRDNPRDNRGSYEGSDLFLLVDGTFVELAYGGSWSRWQGSSWGWKTTERTMTIAEVAHEYKLEPIVEALSEALDQHTQGGRPARAKAMRERAAKLAALVALI